MALLDQPVRGVQKSIPGEDQHTKKRECAEPPPHEEPPAVERALKVKREAHRQIPREHGPTEREEEHGENRELSLA